MSAYRTHARDTDIPGRGLLGPFPSTAGQRADAGFPGCNDSVLQPRLHVTLETPITHREVPLTYYGGAAALVLIQQTATARSRGPVTITGEVVDPSGAPVGDYDVAAFWSANGVVWDKYGNNLPPDPTAWTDKGVMEPMPNATALPLVQGCFRLQFPEEREVYSLVAMSKNRKMGRIVLVGREAAKTPAVISVHSLVNVHGSIICRENDVVPRLTDVFLHPASDEGKYAPVARCRSVIGRFSFWLPPGSYDLDIRGSQPTARLPKPRKGQEASEAMQPRTGRLRITINGLESESRSGRAEPTAPVRHIGTLTEPQGAVFPSHPAISPSS